MSVKVLINAEGVRALIGNNPEIEVELANSAAAQVADHIAKRARPYGDDLAQRVRAAFDQIVREQHGRFGMPETVREVIRRFLAEECTIVARESMSAAAKAEAKKIADEAVRNALGGLEAKVQKVLDGKVERARAEVDDYIKEAVEQQVIALLRGGQMKIVGV